MDIAAVGGAFEAVKALVGITKATADAIVDEKQREKLFEIRAGLMDLQAKVLDDQQSRMELLKQLDIVTKERDSLQVKKSVLDDYELVAVSDGRYVYKARLKQGTTEHFACPNCITSNGIPSVLQVEGGYRGGDRTRYWCTQCLFQIFI